MRTEIRRAKRAAAPLETRVVATALGLFAVVSFLVCIVWGLVTPSRLHMEVFLEQVLPAFVWLTPSGFLLGLAESFLYGVYAGLVFCPIYNALHRRSSRSANDEEDG